MVGVVVFVAVEAAVVVAEGEVGALASFGVDDDDDQETFLLGNSAEVAYYYYCFEIVAGS